MAGADLPGAVSQVSLLSISPAIDGSETTVGLVLLIYADRADVNVDSLKAAINKDHFLTVNMVVGVFEMLLALRFCIATAADVRDKPVPSSPDDDICRAARNETRKFWSL